MGKTIVNGVIRDMTAEEQSFFDARQKEFSDDKTNRQIKQIRQIRNQKLSETDWWVISEQITDEQKTWRENLRKIPQDYTTENQYDLLLARNDDGKLTHSIWEKP